MGPDLENDVQTVHRSGIWGSSHYSMIVDEAGEPHGSGSVQSFAPTKVCWHFQHHQSHPDPSEVFDLRSGNLIWQEYRSGDVAEDLVHTQNLDTRIGWLPKIAYDINVKCFSRHISAHGEDMDYFRDPTLNRGFSVINFLWELNELGALFKQLKALRRWLRAVIGGERKLTWGRLCDEIAGGTLGVAFGILPLISDLAAIWQTLTRFQVDKARLEDLRGKSLFQTLGRDSFPFEDNLIQDALPLDSLPIDFGGIGPAASMTFEGYRADLYWIYTANVSDNKPSASFFRSGIGYNYSLPEAKSRLARVRQYLSAFGVDADLAIVWNATPWTFLLDWFIGVSGFLHSQRVSVFPVDVALTDALASHRFSLRRSVWTRIEQPYYGENHPNRWITVPLVDEWVSFYERTRDKVFLNLNKRPTLEHKALRLRHLVIGGALAWLTGRRSAFRVLRNARYNARRNAVQRKRLWRALREPGRKWAVESLNRSQLHPLAFTHHLL